MKKIIPQFARRPLLAILIFNFISYYVPKLLEPYRQLHVLSTALDDALPLVPGFIYVYVLAYVQWVVAYVVIARDSPEGCRRFASAELTAKAIAMVILLVWPTTLVRPAVEGRDLTTGLLAWIYRADTPTNLFPSPHCLASWFCFRCSIGLRKMPKWYAWVQGVFTLLVFASVLLVKQHVWPDVLGGIAVAELGIALSRALHSRRVAAKLNPSARSHA